MIDFINYKYIVYISGATLLVIALFVYYIYWKKKMISLMPGAENLVLGSKKRTLIKNILIIVSIITAAVCLLRPGWGDRMREVHNEGSDVLIALDVSNSMRAADIKPSRLEKAKSAVRWIANSLKGDRIGLILFAGDAFLQCPLTSDISAFMMFLDSAGPDSVRLQGTDIGKVLNETGRVFSKKRLTSKLLVLITDGEDHEGAALEAIPFFRENDISVYTLGIGRSSGENIPVGTEESTGDIYYRDSKGELVTTRKNPDLLKKLAASTGGAYIDISDSFADLNFILEIIEDQQATDFGSRMIKERKERYQIFTGLLILLLMIEVMIPERPYDRKRRGIKLLPLFSGDENRKWSIKPLFRKKKFFSNGGK